MAYVNLLNVTVMNNPAPFTSPFQFEITFECLKELKEGMSTV
jgi:histone chaperone ASF1